MCETVRMCYEVLVNNPICACMGAESLILCERGGGREERE